MLDRFVVTGCGRSGTRFVAELLTASGVRCGHEAAHSHAARGRWPAGLVADSSWMAACMLDVVTVPVVLLVRHPLAVVRSWVEIGFFSRDAGNPTHGPLRSAYPEVYRHPEPHDRALAMWVKLTSATLQRAELVLRLEDLAAGPGPLRRLLGWCGGDPGRADQAHAAVGRVNRHEASRRATGISWSPAWEQHDGALAARAWGLADDLGLGPDEEVTSG